MNTEDLGLQLEEMAKALHHTTSLYVDAVLELIDLRERLVQALDVAAAFRVLREPNVAIASLSGALDRLDVILADEEDNGGMLR